MFTLNSSFKLYPSLCTWKARKHWPVQMPFLILSVVKIHTRHQLKALLANKENRT